MSKIGNSKMYNDIEKAVFEAACMLAYENTLEVSPDDLTDVEFVENYWTHYIASCEMATPTDGMELIG